MASASAGDASWKGRDVLAVDDFSDEMLRAVFSAAVRMRDMVLARGGSDLLKGRILANVFFEPSTRTMSSFDAGMKRLGGQVISVSEVTSSAKKGESIEDTVRCLECYCDALVVRHPEVGTLARAAAAASKPVINAGDGVGEHPTQALLDLFTMATAAVGQAPSTPAAGPSIATPASASSASDTPATTTPASATSAAAGPATAAATPASAAASVVDCLGGKTLTLLGDLKHGRTTHSIALLCSRLARPPRLVFVSPAELAMPDTICAQPLCCSRVLALRRYRRTAGHLYPLKRYKTTSRTSRAHHA
jgi:carbamoyl-phosphate synthase/aspartate carbamoyltransferase/dihydroorotase